MEEAERSVLKPLERGEIPEGLAQSLKRELQSANYAASFFQKVSSVQLNPRGFSTNTGGVGVLKGKQPGWMRRRPQEADGRGNSLRLRGLFHFLGFFVWPFLRFNPDSIRIV